MLLLVPTVLLLSVALFVPSSLLARTWHVSKGGSGDAPTIQAGIDSAAWEDLVLVGPGTYYEHLDFLGKDIWVKSEAGPEVTIIDASLAPARGVVFVNGETREATLEGFTVRGANPATDAAGIFILRSEPTIRGNIIRDNEAIYVAGPRETGWGGGIFTGASEEATSPLIIDNVILNNRAGSNGGGIAVASGGAEILNNVIEGNELLYGDGGGIWISSRVNGIVIRGNVIRNNVAGDHGGGVYAGLNGNTPPYLAMEIDHNVIAQNVALAEAMTGDSGGGLWLRLTSAWVHHNTIVENEGHGSMGDWGGAIAFYRASGDLIEQNIIAFSVNGGGIRCGEGTTPTIRNNLAWANVGGDGAGICSDWWQTNGNIVADPIICGLEVGDYTVSIHSPALSHPAGPLGAFPEPTCDIIKALPTTWGALKTRYR
jgi:hypothetical protein